MYRSMTRLTVWCGLLMMLCVSGCRERGPRRYHISGTVRFHGQPVPHGTISFDPESQGLGGGFAAIQNGEFDTSQEGRGHLGGRHRIRITGSDGTLLNPSNPDSGHRQLFPPYETTADLPAKPSSLDFEVPADGGRLTTR